MANHLHKGDLPEGLSFGKSVAIDTETMGLAPMRDRLSLVQLSAWDWNTHIIQFEANNHNAPRLTELLESPEVTKIFHYARFDVATLRYYLGVLASPVYCTKIASKLARTYTDRHGLKDLCKDLLDVEISKQLQSSDWGSSELSEEQLGYAANDVLYLHQLRDILDKMLTREQRSLLATAAFAFLPIRAELDLAGWENIDLFAH